MGQRLNIEIVKGSKLLANSYYHWSGYSSSSIELLKVIKKYIDNNENKDDLLYAIKMLESTGAGLTDNQVSDEEIKFAKIYYAPDHFDKWIKRVLASQLKTAQTLYPNETFNECQGRNTGLIAITQEEMDNTRDWEEARVTIDLETSIIDYGAVYEESVEEFIKWYDKEPSIKEIELDLTHITFDDLDYIYELVKQFTENEFDLIRDSNGKLLQFIE